MKKRTLMALFVLVGSCFVAGSAFAGAATVRNCVPNDKTNKGKVTFRAYNTSGGLPTSKKDLKYNKKHKLKCDKRVQHRRCNVCAYYSPKGNTNVMKTCRKMSGHWILRYQKHKGNHWTITWKKGKSCG